MVFRREVGLVEKKMVFRRTLMSWEGRWCLGGMLVSEKGWW